MGRYLVSGVCWIFGTATLGWFSFMIISSLVYDWTWLLSILKGDTEDAGWMGIALVPIGASLGLLHLARTAFQEDFWRRFREGVCLSIGCAMGLCFLPLGLSIFGNLVHPGFWPIAIAQLAIVAIFEIGAWIIIRVGFEGLQTLD